MEFCLRGKTAKTNIYDGFLIFCYFSSVPLFHSYSSKAFHIVFKLHSLCLPRGWRWGAGGGGLIGQRILRGNLKILFKEKGGSVKNFRRLEVGMQNLFSFFFFL